MLGSRQGSRIQAALQEVLVGIWRREGIRPSSEQERLRTKALCVAWFYAEGIDGSISKMPVQVTAAKPGTIIYVDDTGEFDVGIPLTLSSLGG
jgi:hypothetical protein